MSEQLGRTLKGNIETAPASIEKSVTEKIAVKLGMYAVVHKDSLKASESESGLQIVLRKKGGEVDAVKILLLSSHRCGQKEMIHDQEFDTEHGLNRIVGRLPDHISSGRLDSNVLMKGEPSGKKVGKYKPVHTRLLVSASLKWDGEGPSRSGPFGRRLSLEKGTT